MALLGQSDKPVTHQPKLKLKLNSADEIMKNMSKVVAWANDKRLKIFQFKTDTGNKKGLARK